MASTTHQLHYGNHKNEGKKKKWIQKEKEDNHDQSVILRVAVNATIKFDTMVTRTNTTKLYLKGVHHTHQLHYGNHKNEKKKKNWIQKRKRRR